MFDPGREEKEAAWRKNVVREIDRALDQGKSVDAATLAGGDRVRTAEVETLISVREAIRAEDLDSAVEDPSSVTAIEGPLADAERLLLAAFDEGGTADLSAIEAEHPKLSKQFEELKRFYSFLGDALTGDPATIESSAKLPEFRIGKYKLARILGSHPLGRLDAATEEPDGGGRVLLLLNPALPKTTALRLLRDAAAVRRLNDPGFVPLVEIGEADGVRFLAFVDVGGETLERRHERGADAGRSAAERLPEAARIVGQLAASLHRAHAQGVLALDLRPSNVVMTPDGAPLIRGANLLQSLRGAWRGVGADQAFIAPEALDLEGASVDWRADVYGLAALLYLLIAGESPEPTASACRSSLAGVPESVVDLIERGLADDPKLRPASCLVLAGALKPHAGRARVASAMFGRRRLVAVGFAAAAIAAAYFFLFRR